MDEIIYVCSYCNQQTMQGKRSRCCGDAIYTVDKYYLYLEEYEENKWPLTPGNSEEDHGE